MAASDLLVLGRLSIGLDQNHEPMNPREFWPSPLILAFVVTIRDLWWWWWWWSWRWYHHCGACQSETRTSTRWVFCVQENLRVGHREKVLHVLELLKVERHVRAENHFNHQRTKVPAQAAHKLTHTLTDLYRVAHEIGAIVCTP